LNREKFDSLCKVCDDILQGGGGVDLDRIALPALHVVNAHPSSELVKSLLPSSTFKSLVKQFKFFVKNLRDYALSLSGQRSFYANKETLRNVDVVFISHLIQSDLSLSEKDFYYDQFPDLLNKVKLRSAIVYRNIVKANPNHLKGKWDKSECTRIIPNKTLGILKEFNLRLRLRNILKVLQAYIRNQHQGNSLAKKVIELIDSYASIESLRFCDQMKEVFLVLKPKIVFVTFEGHAWERAVFGVARAINPKIICIGYQHTVLNGTEHGISRGLGLKFDPQMIWATGLGPAQTLTKKINPMPSGGITVYGTYRSLSSLILCQEKNIHSVPQCLITPDGTMEESEYMFSFAIRIAELNPKVRFVIRFHPLLPYSQLAKQHSRFRGAHKNLFISSNNAGDDIANSKYIIYRGSSMVIPAVIYGLRPIYLKKENSIDIDPLHMLVGEWRKIITRDADLLQIMSENNDVAEERLRLSREIAQEYCRKYFQPPNTKEALNTLKILVENV
jgi:hypothetical protein